MRCSEVERKKKDCNSQAQAVGRDFPLCVYVGIGNVFVCECEALCFCRCPENDRSQSYRLCASQPASQTTLLLSDRHNVCVIARRHIGYRRTDNINVSYETELLT